MSIVESRKVVSIKLDPESEDDSSMKLAQFFHDELKRRQQVDEVWQKENEGQANTVLMNIRLKITGRM